MNGSAVLKEKLNDSTNNYDEIIKTGIDGSVKNMINKENDDNNEGEWFISKNVFTSSKHIYQWTVHDVAHWMRLMNFDAYTDLFCHRHLIDGRVLIHLTENDLRSEPLKIDVFGHVKLFCLALDHLRRIYAIENNVDTISKRRISRAGSRKLNHKKALVGDDKLEAVDVDSFNFIKSSTISNNKQLSKPNLTDSSDEYNKPYSQNHPPNSYQSYSTTVKQNKKFIISSSMSSSSLSSENSAETTDEENKTIKISQRDLINHRVEARIVPKLTSGSEFADLVAASHFSVVNHHSVQKYNSSLEPNRFIYNKPSRNSSQSDLRDANRIMFNRNLENEHHHYRHHHHRKNEIKPEAWKTIVALLYFLSSTWVTAIVMVIVHDRVPDMDTYPPLPDLLLDNLPRIPWAFSMCELCGVVLFSILGLILMFHKYRFIVMRRIFSLFGSVFLIRCFTMLITSLSVPGRHLECKARPYGSWSERLYQACLIWQGGGLSIQGVRTCGDYMFSGHTVVLTLLNFFITEYTPSSFSMVHTMSWVLNSFGIFFILAAHEHYSIDVFIAFYISTRLFLYYHTLANNRALYQSDRRRTRIWFPLFSFFESGVVGIVPNEYEIPFRATKQKLTEFLLSKFEKQISLMFDDNNKHETYQEATSTFPPVNDYKKKTKIQ